MQHVIYRELCASSRCHTWSRSVTLAFPCTPHSKSAAPSRRFRKSLVQSVTACVQRDSLLRTTDDADPGHWEYSPEWWGTHAGGWGRDAGKVLFSQQSHCGNGEVWCAHLTFCSWDGLIGISLLSTDHSDCSSCFLHTCFEQLGTGMEGVEVQ